MIPFSPPRIDEKIIAEVTDTLRSGWITTGPKTKRFEQELQQYMQCRRVLCVNSATAGLELMLRWFGVGPGDEVIVPAYTYSATANVVIHCGATPVFADCGEDFNMHAEGISSLITTRTKVIMPVDIGGWPCDYDALNALVNTKAVKSLFRPAHPNQQQLGRIMILSDAAHSIGATYKNKKAGALTDVSVTSFHAVKNLTTAEGGAICLNFTEFNCDDLYKSLYITSLHGQTKDALAKMQPGQWKYDIIEAGYKCNMTDILASIGLVELSRYETETLPRRKEIVKRYMKWFSACDWALLPPVENEIAGSSCHLFLLRVKGVDETRRDAIIQKIFEKQVSVNVHFIPVPMMSYYTSLGYDIKNYPVTFSMYENEISLPVYFDLTPEQTDTVAQKLIESVHEVCGW